MAAPPPKVSKELNTAFAEEALKQAQDAAKFRAVDQRVDYETFKNMVSVAHLRPLQAPNTGAAGGKVPPAWTFDAGGTSTSDGAAASADPLAQLGGALRAALPPDAPPASAREFEQAWRRGAGAPANRAALLRRTPPDAYARFFKVEINLVLLGEMLGVLEEMLPGEGAPPADAAAAAGEVAAILAGVAGSGRFAVTAKLLAGKPRAAAARVLARLQELAAAAGEGDGAGGGCGALQADVVKLREVYGIAS